MVELYQALVMYIIRILFPLFVEAFSPLVVAQMSPVMTKLVFGVYVRV